MLDTQQPYLKQLLSHTWCHCIWVKKDQKRTGF